MSVFVSDFSNWTVVHDDAPGGAHQGTIDPASIAHTTNMDGSENHLFLLVTCPVCQSVSTHPVGGGAQPALVQELFTRKMVSDGCPCPAKLPKGRAFGLAKGHAKQHAEQMDGVGRWQVPPGLTS